jgi:uncharacterized protein YjeT (DUF2065 family)
MAGILASALVLLTGLYLVGLAATSFIAPALAVRFFHGFAGSAFAHYLELLLRMAVGAAFLLHSSHMLFAGIWALFGWVLVITTAVLAAVPWHWHRRFAQRSVPHAVRHLRLVGLTSFVFGAFVLLALTRGIA